MIRSIDHVVLLVQNLDIAIADYGTLGFTVTPGGEHTGGETHNALIAFADGSYIELIAFKRDAPDHRWARHRAYGEGLIDFALLPTATTADVAEARSRGLAIQGPVDGGRTRPDGQVLRWQTAMPVPQGMPFLCGDLTPRTLRVPGGTAHQHPNGITGISSITVAVRDAQEAARQYAALLGIESPPTAHMASLGLHVAICDLDHDALALAQPVNNSGPLADQLATRGPGIYAITFVTDQVPPTYWPSATLAHGARMELYQA